MFSLNLNIEIPLNDNDRHKVENFVNADHSKKSHRHYEEQRGAKDASANTRMGKFAEIGVEKYLRSIGETAQACFEELPIQNKWDADIIGEKYNRHIKSCEGSKSWGNSWTFQLSNKDGKGGRDPVLDSNNPFDLFVGVSVPKAETHVKILVVMPFLAVKKYLEDPKMDYLVGIKTVLNHETLLKNIDEINEWLEQNKKFYPLVG